MKRQIQKILFFFEMRSFGVCDWWAKKIGIKRDKVRLGFIYASFLTIGSPLFIYMIMAWVLEHKHYFKLSRKENLDIWEL